MRVTAKSFIVIGLMALVFILLFKWVAMKSKVAGLQRVAQAA